MSFSSVRAVYVKELRSLMRDRHILLYSVLLPALLYPLLVFGIVQILTAIRGLEERQVARIEVVGGRAADELRAFIAEREHAADAQEDASRPIELLPGSSSTIDRDAARTRLEPASPSDDVGVVVAVREPDAAADFAGAPRDVEVFYSDAIDTSRVAKARVDDVLEEWRHERLVLAANAIGEDASFLETIHVDESSLSTPAELANHLAGMILPLLLILMTALGAFYPALEATVGEKERGTLETTLLAPVGRSAIALGKYLAVTTLSLLSFVLNFCGLSLTVIHLQAQLPTGQFSLGLRAIVIIVLAAVLLAAFFSAAMMMLAFLARSFKEGQSYVTPIYMAAVVPVIVALHPDIHLTPPLALVPMINTTLLFRDAIQGSVEPVCVVLTLGSSALCAGLALWAACRLIGRESIATGASVTFRQAMTFLFRPKKIREVPE